MDVIHYLLKTDLAIKLDCIVDNIRGTQILSRDHRSFGLFATERISAGMDLCVLDGQTISLDFFNDMKKRLALPSRVQDSAFMEWNFLSNHQVLVRMFKTKFSYVNHSEKPNCKLLGFPPKLWSIDDILLGDELTLKHEDVSA